MFGMKRRKFIALLGGAAAWPLAASSQQAKTTVPRIGWLVTGSPTSYRLSLAAFRDGLKTLGYVEGKNIRIEYRWAEGNVARLAELANELVQQNVDVILAGGSVGAEAAGVTDLVEIGLVASLARPGGNLTGFVAGAPEAAAKRFEIIREIKPQTRRVVVLWNPTSSSAKVECYVAKEFAAANHLDLALYGARDVDELSNALTNLPESTPDGLVVLNDPLMFTYRKTIVDAASRFRLPSTYYANLSMMEE